MMKKNSLISVVILVLAGLFGLLEPAYSMDAALERQPSIDTTALLLQQSDPDAGTVTPNIGVHHFSSNAEVVLTAVSKPSYRFLYWIGDVSDPTANRTVVYLDTPKIIIAVFERSKYELLGEEWLLTYGAYGGLHLTEGDYGNQGSLYAETQEWEWPEWPEWPEPPQPQPEEVPDDFPVPDDDLPDDFPVPVPEPATIMLLGLGGLLFIRCSPNSLRRTKR